MDKKHTYNLFYTLAEFFPEVHPLREQDCLETECILHCVSVLQLYF